MYDDLVPRWQGVLHTAEAEIEANKTRSLPWANIKFSHYMENGHKTVAVGSKGFEKWEEINFPAAGESMSSKEQAQYKYHIDLGGGGEYEQPCVELISHDIFTDIGFYTVPSSCAK